jgi:chromosomal replication initiator protein
MLLGQLVHGSDAARASALYLYGENGTGKTHLLRGLAAAVERQTPGEVLYLSSRKFTIRYVAALRAKDIQAVRAFEVDLQHRRFVLIDDVHALARRPATQHGLARLREAALGTGTRFVFAARRHPKDLEGFSGRLRSWLLDGVLLRLGTPDATHRRAILEQRARTYGLDLSDAVAAWIEDRTASVRGAVDVLDRWAAVSVELGAPLEARWLDEVAPEVTATASEEIVRRAKRAVAAHWGLPPRVLDVATKARRAALPRRVAMYLVYRAAALPLAEIGRSFGLRSHSSACRAIQRVREERDRDPALEQVIEGLLVRM